MKRLICLILMAALLLPAAGALEPDGTPPYRGIDVSAWQGEIDFRAVAEDGIEIVYLKAGQGADWVDPTFERNFAAARQAGLKVGAYYYFTARTPEQARHQAHAFAALLAGKELQCRPALDFEDLAGLTDQEINELSAIFLREVERLTGKRTLLYSDAYNAQRVFRPELLEQVPLWLAQYGVERPDNAGAWRTWAGWQYSDRGQVPGIRPRTDLDRFTKTVLLADPEAGAVPDPGPAPERTERTRTVVVRRGDTLWAIARRYHTTVRRIAEENGIRNPNRIYPGQVLRLTLASNAPVSDSWLRVTIRRGDTLWAIARRYGTTVARLVQDNRMTDPNLIYPGQILLVPWA